MASADPFARPNDLDAYSRMYDHTLGTIRAERPTPFAGVKLSLDRFEPPSSGQAFFPGGADYTLADPLTERGWSVDFEEGDYLYTAVHPQSGAVLQHVEGDVYCLRESRASELSSPIGVGVWQTASHGGEEEGQQRATSPEDRREERVWRVREGEEEGRLVHDEEEVVEQGGSPAPAAQDEL